MQIVGLREVDKEHWERWRRMIPKKRLGKAERGRRGQRIKVNECTEISIK